MILPTYKFLDTMHIDSVLRDGSIKLGSLDHYRQMEGEQWIADRLEGSVMRDLHGHFTDSELQELSVESPITYVRVMGGGKVQMKNVEYRWSTANAYIFSASRGPLDVLTMAMCTNAKRPYDACLKVSDLHWLASRILHFGHVGKCSASDIFERFEIGMVSYEKLRKSAAEGPLPQPDPFLKDVSLKDQSEIRIAFHPRKPMAEPFVMVTIPHPEHIFAEEFRNLSTGQQA